MGIQVDGSFQIESGDSVSSAAEAMGRPGQWPELTNENLSVLLEGYDAPPMGVGEGLLSVAALQARPGMILKPPLSWAPPPPPPPPARSGSRST